MANFRQSGNVFKQINDRVFLQTRHRIDFNNRFYSNNDFVTKIDIPKEFFKEHFKFERFSGIYRTELRYKDILNFISVWTNDVSNLPVKAFKDMSYSKEGFINYGVIRTVQGENRTIQPFTSGVRLGEEITITSKDILFR